MEKKPYLPQRYFALDDQWSSRAIVNHAGRPAKLASLAPDALSFGSVTAGNLSTVQRVTLTNIGYLPLFVRGVKLAGDFVVSHNLPVDGWIPVDGSAEFQIQYAPQRAGIATGGLYVNTDADGTNEYVGLLGNGLAAGVGVASLSASSLAFGNVATGATSTAKTVTITNTGSEDLTISSVATTGQFVTTFATPKVLTAGQSAVISVVFKPTTDGAKTGTVTINHDGNGGNTIALSGTGGNASTLPTITISNGVIGAVTSDASVSASTTTLSFSNTVVGETSSAMTVNLTNSGGKEASITGLTLTGSQFALASGSAVLGTTIPAGSVVAVKVQMTPDSVSDFTGSLSITTDAPVGDSFTVSLSGSGVEEVVVLERLHIAGNQFVNESGANVRLKSVNWFGMESANYTPHGTWTQPWKNIINDIASMGFNCIRFPFSGDTTTSGRTPPAAAIDETTNPDLVGLSSLAILDLYIDYCTHKGIYVVLDHHRRVAGDGADGSPISDTYTMTNWQQCWAVMANRYGSNSTVVGADLHNEPHDLTWSVWAGYVETCANYILTLAPQWLFFVEGVGTNGDGTTTWWGGALKDVATRPIALSVANKVAYSPHEYGQSVGSQTWLSTDSNPVSGYPTNLYAVWDANWGFIYKTNIAPIWIGEFGGKFGVDGTGTNNQPNGTVEKQWATTLQTYMNGDFNGDGTSDLTSGKKGLSFAYWGYNPNSSDTGGLVQDDWVTHQNVKLALLNPILS